MLSFNLKKIAAAAAVLLGTVAVTTPAAASPISYRLVCGYTTSGLRCWYQPSYATQTNTSMYSNRTSTPTYAPQTTTVQRTTPAQPTAATASVSGLTANEQQMLNLINQERARYGLTPLKADLQVTKVARVKSQEMISRNYFSHQSPTYGSPFDMLKRFGITYRTAGENIAGNNTVTAAHKALMNSSGHRANILSRNFTHIGIGVVPGGQYGMMFTQMFVGK
jgi:uncharacterized YkwD family protein